MTDPMAVSPAVSSRVDAVADIERRAVRPALEGAAGAEGFGAVLARTLAAGGAATATAKAPQAAPAADADGSGRLRLSAHAAHRLQAAGIDFEGPERRAVEAAAARAAARGGRDCLALTARAAYIVHLPSGTVVTAVAGERMREGVFTGIDSAVIAAEEGLDR